MKTDAYVIEKSNSGVREVSLMAKHLQQRKIFLYGILDADVANRFLLQMMYMEEESSREVNIYINSLEGDINAGLLMYDVITASKMPINLYCTGELSGIATLLLAAGKKGRRYILPHSEVSLHESAYEDRHRKCGFAEIEETPGLDPELNNIAMMVGELFSKHTGRTTEEVYSMMLGNEFMNAQETIEFGICDKIGKICK